MTQLRPSAVLVLGALLLAAPTRADDDRPAPVPALQLPGSPATDDAAERAAREALDDGLRWLARAIESSPDGALPRLEAEKWAPVGVTALGSLALMAGGHSPGRGPHGKAVERSTTYLLRKCDLDPASPRRGFVSAPGDAYSRMHGHGYATLALAQTYGMTPRSERLKEALVAAVRRIESSQSLEGGWWYEPERGVNHEGSVTIALVQALRAARNAGVDVDRDVVRRAEDYVERLQKEDGTFRYMLDDPRSTVGLTAASIATLNMAGRYDGASVQRGVDAIWTRLETRRGSGDPIEWPHYERLHLAQALWQLADDDVFRSWFDDERVRMLRTRNRDGSWSDREYGDAYATAVNCLVLALPQGLLPIFQR